MKKHLKTMRAEIDEIDRKLKTLLLKREKLIKRVGKLKKLHNLKIEDKTREKKILKSIKSPFVKKTFKTILTTSKSIQKQI